MAGLWSALGKEPRPGGRSGRRAQPAFDWTALETAADCIAWASAPGRRNSACLSSSRHRRRQSQRFQKTGALSTTTLLSSGLLQVESIMPGSRAAALLRQRQAVFGDALVILGGGTGVEHSAICTCSAANRSSPLICRSEPAAMTAPVGLFASQKRPAASLLVSFVLTLLLQIRKALHLPESPHATAPRPDATLPPKLRAALQDSPDLPPSYVRLAQRHPSEIQRS